MSKQLQRSDRNDDYKSLNEIPIRHNHYHGEEESDSSRDVRIPTYRSRDTANSTLSILCNNQAEEIKQLYDQLSRRELDLKEMRYNYINAVKGGQSNNAADSGQSSSSELRGSLHLTSGLTDGGAIDPKFSSVNQEITKGEYDNDYRDDNDDDDDDENNSETSSQNEQIFRQSYPTVNDFQISKRSLPQYLNNMETRDRDRDRLIIRKNEKINDGLKNENVAVNARASSSSFPLSNERTQNEKNKNNHKNNYKISQGEYVEKSRKAIRENKNENDNVEIEIEKNQNNNNNNLSFQVSELKEFRDKITTEYGVLQKSYDTLKLETEENSFQLRESAGRLIRFVTGMYVCLYVRTCLLYMYVFVCVCLLSCVRMMTSYTQITLWYPNRITYRITYRCPSTYSYAS